jgi:hypothetical protein
MRRTVRHPRSLLGIAFLALLVLAGCSLTEPEISELEVPEPEPEVLCSSEVSAQEASYFPNALGQQWRYAYHEREAQQTSPYENTTTGTLLWRISKRTDRCSEIDFEVTETFDGQLERRFMGSPDTTFAVAWEKVLHAQLRGHWLVLKDYTDGTFSGLDSLRWVYPITAPEVIRQDSTVFCGFGGCTEVQSALQRDVGLTLWSFTSSHRDVFTRTLTLEP